MHAPLSNATRPGRRLQEAPEDHPYLKRQLIAYLGNKRRLLPFFGRVFAELADTPDATVPPRFVDPFAGSGAVSRLAKLMGFHVAANDWELYSYILNAAYLGVDRRDLPALFRRHGGIAALLSELNALYDLGTPPPVPYITTHYAPAATEDADYRWERLFYTRENALFIDRVRERIEVLYPEIDADGLVSWSHAASPAVAAAGRGSRADCSNAATEKVLLIALLLVEASTHANTSGVFKAYHKGFGGHGRDALRRILGRMELEMPELIDGAADRAIVRSMDAAAFLASHSGDIIYLDPPYNSHQYGSNYFMLNTIARWDRPTVPDRRGPDGRFSEKAGIRRDWKRTRSDFCSRGLALNAFETLLDRADGRHLVLSYNTEGIVPLEELLDLLERHGRVRMFGRDYVKYRGGKQSLHRHTRNTEFLVVVTRDEGARPRDRREVQRFLRRRRVEALLGQPHNPARLEEMFRRDGGTLRIPASAGSESEARAAARAGRVLSAGVNVELGLRLEEGHRPVVAEGDLSGLSEAVLEWLESTLGYTACGTRQEEVLVIAEVLRGDAQDPRERRRLVAKLLKALRKFAYRKYEETFLETRGKLIDLARREPERFPGLMEGIESLYDLLRRRKGGGHAG
ncbi:MAG: DNA adenine methylase [Spirochaetota bacterium]